MMSTCLVEVMVPDAPVPGGDIEVATSALQAVVDRIVADLDLPVAAELRLRPAAPDETLDAGRPFRLAIDGEPVRARIALDAAGDPELDLAAVADALFDNRAAFVRRGDLLRYRQRTAHGHDGVSDDELLATLRALCRLGVRSSRLDAARPGEPIGTVADRCHDDALHLEVDLDQGAASLADVLRDMGNVLGVPLPPIVVSASGAPGDSCRIRINDVRLPPSVESAGPAIARAIRHHLFAFVSGDLVELLLAALARHEEALVTAVRDRFPTVVLRDAFRLLLDEGVSIGRLHEVLEAMLVAHGRSRASDSGLVFLEPHTGGMLACGRRIDDAPLDAKEIAELVRGRDPLALRNDVLGRLDDPLRAVVATRSFDGELLSLAAAPSREARASIVARTVRALRAERHDPATPDAIVVSTPSRRILRETIAVELPDVRVLGWSELSDDTPVEPTARLR